MWALYIWVLNAIFPPYRGISILISKTQVNHTKLTYRGKGGKIVLSKSGPQQIHNSCVTGSKSIFAISVRSQNNFSPLPGGVLYLQENPHNG